MGKAIYFLTFLVLVDLVFIATGQLCATGVCSLSSIIFNAALNLGSVPLSQLFTEFVGDALNLFNSGTGFAALLATGGIIIGAFVLTRDIKILFIPMAFTLALLAGDMVLITAYLISLNPVLATFIMAPISIIYIFTVVEWLRGKD